MSNNEYTMVTANLVARILGSPINIRIYHHASISIEQFQRPI